MDPIEIAHGIVDAISDKLGEDIVLIDVHEQSPFVDYFVICTANSERQIKAITDGIMDYTAKQFKLKPRHIEGNAESGWVLVDYVGVVIHIFSPSQRDFYQLEDLWQEAEAAVLLKMQ